MQNTILTVMIVLFMNNTNVFANNDAYEIFKQGLQLERTLNIFEAREKFIKAIENDPDNSGYLTHYAWFLHNHGFYEEASFVFSKLIAITKNSKDSNFLYRGLGWDLKKLGKLQNSIIAYKNVLDLSHTDDSFTNIFREIKKKINDENIRKIEIIQKDILINQNNIQFKKNLFNACLDTGEINKAITLADEILKEDPDDNFLHIQLARALSWIGEINRSRIEYKKLISLFPDNAFLYYELGHIEELDGNLDSALEAVEQSFSLYPDSVLTKKLLAELLAKKRNTDRAIKIADSIQPAGNDRLNGLLAKANILKLSSKNKEANYLYGIVIKEYPYNTEALWGIIETDRDLRNYYEMRSVITKWKETDFDDKLQMWNLLLPYYLPPNIELKTEYYDNSTKFAMIHTALQFDFYIGKQTRLHTGYNISNFHKDGFNDIKRQSIFAESEKLFSKNIQLSGRIAKNYYNNSNENSNIWLSIIYKPLNRLTTIWKYKYIDIIDTELPFGNPIYNYAVTIGAVGQNIRTDDYSVYLLYEPLSRFWFAGQTVYGNYSDGNKKQDRFFETGYKVSDIPDIRVAYNFFYLDYKNAASVFHEGDNSDSAYYDPINFESHSAKIKFNYIYNKILSYGAEGAVSLIPANSGIGVSVFTFTEFNFDEQNLIRIDARWFSQNKGIDRQGETGSFGAKNLTVSYEYRF